MKNIIQNLPCNDCRQHASRYLSQNPPENYLGLVDGLFIYTIKFHNFVNERLGKPILSEEEAKALYLNPNICYEDCGKEKSIPLVSIAPDLAPILVSVRPYQKKR